MGECTDTINDELIKLVLDQTIGGQASLLENHLVLENQMVIFHPSMQPLELNKGVSLGIILLQRLAMCQSQIKSKLELTCRAGEMFYGKNKFLIWWHGLGDFLSGISTDTKANGSVELIVRNVTVRYDMNEDKQNWRGKKLATELERLFCLENANSVRIEIIGGGSFEGSDMKTQLLLKDICPIVKRLIDHFGDRFKIDKGCGGFVLCPMGYFWPLKKYWDAPDDSIREKVNTGTASFEEHMRVQVEAWLGEGSPSEISLCSDKFPAALWQTHEPFLGDTEWLLQQLHGIVQEAESTEWEMLL